MKKKILILSFDAMVGEDVEYLRKKPDSNFNRLMANCACVDKMYSVYPSITYPAHFSMASGCTPGTTGFYQNGHLLVGNSGKTGWILESSQFGVEDFFAAAKRAGMSTASVYWPSMANNPNIDYLVNEYFFPDPNEDVLEGFARQGANAETLEAVKAAMPTYPKRYRVPGLPTREETYDDFIIDCLCQLIRRYQPDFAVAHHCYIDTMRHKAGLFNYQMDYAVDVVDECIGKVVDTLKEAGVFEDTDIIITSDHGQMQFTRVVRMNRLMQEGGLLTVTAEGKLDTWQAYVQSNGMSACVYLRDPEDEELYKKVYGYLDHLAQQGVWGFTEVMDKATVLERHGLKGGFSFVLESDGYTSFNEGLTGPLVTHMHHDDYRLTCATHGYDPKKGPQPIFYATGPSFKPGAHLEKGSIIDLAPTAAALMGQTLPQAEGRVLQELLK